EGISAVAGVSFGSKAIDSVVGIWAIRPLVGMSPNAQLKVKAAGARFCCDVTQHFEILLAFLFAERHRRSKPRAIRRSKLQHTNIGISGHVDQIRIDEMKIVVRDAS